MNYKIIISVCFITIYIINSLTSCENLIEPETKNQNYIITDKGASFFPQEGATEEDYVPNSIIVKINDNVSAEEIAKFIGGSVRDSFKIENNAYLDITLPNNLDVDEALAILNNKSGFIYAEPNYIYRHFFIPNDEYYAINQYSPQITDCPKAWDIEQGKPFITLSVIDTGVDFHQEFRNRMLDGWDFINKVATAPYQSIDDNGHGSHVAGIAGAAGNNNVGMAGVAWNVKIKPLKVCGDYGCPSYSITSAVRYATDNQGDNRVVINMSLGGAYPSNIAQDANAYAHNKDVVIVCATGNDGKYNIQYPAGYSGNIGVGCTTAEDTLSNFSSKGQTVSVCAPGTDIISVASDTWSGYLSISGTSMSSPFVAGYAALILSANPYLKPSEVKEIIEQTSDPIEGSPPFTWTPEHGWGRVNVGNGVELANNIRKTLRPIEAEILGLEHATDNISSDLINWNVVRKMWDRLDRTNWTWTDNQNKVQTIDRTKWTWTDKRGNSYYLGENTRSSKDAGFRYGGIKVSVCIDGTKVVGNEEGNPDRPIARQTVILMNTNMSIEFKTAVTSDGYSVVNETGGVLPAGEVDFLNVPEGDYLLRAIVEDNNDVYEKITIKAGTIIEHKVVVSPAYPVAAYYLSAFPIYNSFRGLGIPSSMDAPSACAPILYILEESDTTVGSWGRGICGDLGSNGDYFLWPKCHVMIPLGRRYFVLMLGPIFSNKDIIPSDISVNYYGLLVSNRNKIYEYYQIPDKVDINYMKANFPDFALNDRVTSDLEGRNLDFISRFTASKQLSMEPQGTWWLDERGGYYDVGVEKWVDLNRTALTSPDNIIVNKVLTGYLAGNDQDTWILDLTNSENF